MGKAIEIPFTTNIGKNKGLNVPVLLLNPDDKFPFKLGINKCKLVFENINEIESFIKRHDSKQPDQDQPEQPLY